MFVIFPLYLVVFINSFSTRKCFDLFKVTFSFIFCLSSKSVFCTKSAISLLIAKFTCFNLIVKFYAVNLINSGVVIYLLWWGILFLIAVRAVLVAKLVILGIFSLNSFILALRVVLVGKIVISGILSSIYLILTLYTFF